MATRAHRLSEFTADVEPQSGAHVQVLCEDHNGTYVLPFPCHFADGAWRNAHTSEILEAEVIGWRAW